MKQHVQTRLDLAWRRGNLAALLVLCVAAGGALAGRGWCRTITFEDQPRIDPERVQAAFDKVNPNTDGPGSLLRLPEFGPARTEALITYRNRYAPAPAFRCWEDLERVPGIGPVTAQRAAPYVKLPSRWLLTLQPVKAPA